MLSKITHILESIESTLSFNNALQKNIVVYYGNGQHFPGAYNYMPMSTHFKARFNGDTWEIESITREKCPNRKTWNITVYTQDNLVIGRYLIY